MNRSIAFVMVVGIAACGNNNGTPEEVRPPAQSAVERGQYLVTIGGCNDCHTPLKLGPNGPEPDMTRMLSGHPASLVHVSLHTPVCVAEPPQHDHPLGQLPAPAPMHGLGTAPQTSLGLILHKHSGLVPREAKATLLLVLCPTQR